MQEIRTSIAIDASPPEVWSVLTDFASYGEWNPFIRSLEGTLAVGEPLVALIGASGKKAMKISPTVQEHDPGSRFAWKGSLGPKGVFDGRHSFELTKTEDGTRFDHYEEFSGFLVPIVLPAIRRSTTRGFEQMNQAIKSRVETATD